MCCCPCCWRCSSSCLILHLLLGLSQEYAELALGEEADLLPDQQRDMGAFLLSLFKAAVAKRFGAEETLTLSPLYMKALIFRLKYVVECFRLASGVLCAKRPDPYAHMFYKRLYLPLFRACFAVKWIYPLRPIIYVENI